MKKTILLSLIILISCSYINGQTKNLNDYKEISLGFVVVDHLPDAWTIGAGVDYKWLHIDYAKNFADYKSHYEPLDKKPWQLVNVGYNFLVAPYVILTPKVGYYQIGEDKDNLNVGVNLRS